MKNLGGFTFQTSFPQHGWGDSMSDNMLKASVLLNLTVMSPHNQSPALGERGRHLYRPVE